MKKRYAILLTVENVKRFEALAKKISMPRSTMHTIIDESFEAAVSAMERFTEKGSPTITDLFTAMGEQIEQMQKDEQMQKEEVKQNEANTVSAGSARIVKKRKEKKAE